MDVVAQSVVSCSIVTKVSCEFNRLITHFYLVVDNITFCKLRHVFVPYVYFFMFGVFGVLFLCPSLLMLCFRLNYLPFRLYCLPSRNVAVQYTTGQSAAFINPNMMYSQMGMYGGPQQYIPQQLSLIHI